MASDPWVYVLDDLAIHDARPYVVTPRGVPVLLIKKEGLIYAVSNKCSHMGCPLNEGALKGFLIQCPCHEWRYDIRTGVFVDAEEITLKKYEWKVLDGRVFIKIEV